MAKVFECESGTAHMPVKDDDEVVANRQAHLDRAHPDLGGTLSRQHILADAQEA
jgi:hypothetical protein